MIIITYALIIFLLIVVTGLQICLFILINTLQEKKYIDWQVHVIEKGYRPTGRLDTSKPPKGGSAVPSK